MIALSVDNSIEKKTHAVVVILGPDRAEKRNCKHRIIALKVWVHVQYMYTYMYVVMPTASAANCNNQHILKCDAYLYHRRSYCLWLPVCSQVQRGQRHRVKNACLCSTYVHVVMHYVHFYAVMRIRRQENRVRQTLHQIARSGWIEAKIIRESR